MGPLRFVRKAMPPVIMWVVRLAGVAVAAKLLTREWQRVNDELDAARARPSADPRPSADARHPTLERDPHTGVYRPK